MQDMKWSLLAAIHGAQLGPQLGPADGPHQPLARKEESLKTFLTRVDETARDLNRAASASPPRATSAGADARREGVQVQFDTLRQSAEATEAAIAATAQRGAELQQALAANAPSRHVGTQDERAEVPFGRIPSGGTTLTEKRAKMKRQQSRGLLDVPRLMTSAPSQRRELSLSHKREL